MAGILGKFHVGHDAHGVRLTAGSHRLSGNFGTDEQIDTAIEMLKDDLDACGREMKRLIALDRRGSLFEGWPDAKDPVLNA